MLFDLENDSGDYGGTLGAHCEYPDEVVMQYTGLKDRNGKEVYDGDIIDFGGLKPLRIIWRDAGFKTILYIQIERKMIIVDDPILLTQEGFSKFVEIIGNIYENPELLDKQKTDEVE